MSSTIQTTGSSGVVHCEPLAVLAEPTELRCSSCYHWYNPIPNEAEDIKLPRNKPFLRRWAKRLVRDHCPKCRQELVDLALTNDRKDATIANEKEEPEFSTLTKEDVALKQKRRRRATVRDVQLYQALIDTGTDLPPLAEDSTSWFDNVDHPTSLLTRKQERTLLLGLQDRGAFDWPGMREAFRRQPGESLSEEQMYLQIKNQGCKWDMRNGWVSERGRRIRFQEPEIVKMLPRKAKEWGSKVRIAGKKLPPRLDLEEPRLDTIDEVEEDDHAEVASPITSSDAAVALSTAPEIKRETLTDATRSSPELHFAGLPNGVLHTFQSATLRNAPDPRQLQSLGGTVQCVHTSGMYPRLRRGGSVTELQEMEEAGFLRKLVKNIRR